ncbi:MAG: hypothetical protein SPJ74_02460 [Bacilli bacterium]|nr:hypothetical protein [Bacilli bacterium]
MYDVALKVLKELNDNGYKAYIVGGYVRDVLLDIESNDIDITTNATPKQIMELFNDSCLPNEDYGSVIIEKKGYRFEITTFRKEIGYNDNRHPTEVKYIDELYPDLLRRDFVINTICMDSNGDIVDYLNGREDLENKVIRTVDDAYNSFSDDALRILRAIRFATILDFKLSDEVVDAIKKTKDLVRNLSYYRKKSELDKIFTSSNRKLGVSLLLEFGLDEVLELPNLSKILDTNTTSLIGVWSILDVVDKYPFNKNESSLIKDISKAIPLNNLDPMALYKYGLYVNSVASEIKGYDIKNVTESYNNLVIKCRKDIDVTSDDIIKILHKEPGKFITEIYDDIEREILYRRLKNEKEDICNYILGNYE